jgi:hypothetical protein
LNRLSVGAMILPHRQIHRRFPKPSTMRSPTLAFTLALAMPLSAAASNQVISLASVAAQNGYAMRWLGPERSVSLSRPGTVIVIRPGDLLYDVNAHAEIADAPPVATRSGDMLISSWLAGRLRALARRSSVAVSKPAGPVSETARGAAVTAGSIVMHAQELDDTQALAVAGDAPPNAPITLTLLATLAPDVPTVILSRHDVQTDVVGHFDAIVPISPDYLPGTLVTVVATSLPEISPATAYLRLGSPNAGVTVPLERAPRSVR